MSFTTVTFLIWLALVLALYYTAPPAKRWWVILAANVWFYLSMDKTGLLAMAAAALVYLHGGSAVQMANAAAMALKNMMGLVCDPVAGLVEVPCIKRNAAGAMNALCAAEMALAGIESRIPPDEVIDAMAAVGAALPSSLRETGMGGIAASPTAVKFREEFFGQ